MNLKAFLTWVAAVLIAIVPATSRTVAAPASFEVDSTRSRALIEVGKSGAFSFVAGHTHEVVSSTMTGVIHVDRESPTQADVRLDIDARGLKVTGKGDPPEDVPKVQEVMLSPKVLDVARFPTIRYESTNVSIKGQSAATLDLIVTGRLTLRGIAHSVTVPVHVAFDGGELTADGKFSVKQSDYGITPISVAGAVAVKDALAISFTVVARKPTGTP